ncbi:MAG: SDR family oxidoreductase [Cytophagales bacterium]|nr:SDR family oxidoreductase [Cytophagales bacterium]
MNKIALVTGANRGIGFAVAKTLLEKDHSVILTARSESSGEDALTKLGNPDNLYFHTLDVSDQHSVDQIRNFVEQKFGRLDVLINNAGINYDTWQKAENADLTNVQETLDTNLLGPWRMTNAFIPLMKKAGYGRIVNVSSGSGAISGMSGGTPAYSVSKAALNVLTIKLGAELQGTGLLVNAVCPGWVRTDMGGSGATRSPEKGAESIVWAAQLPESGPNGKFFRDKNAISF